MTYQRINQLSAAISYFEDDAAKHFLNNFKDLNSGIKFVISKNKRQNQISSVELQASKNIRAALRS